MSTDIQKYRKYRRENPFLPASYALIWAKTPDASEPWEHDGHDRYTREIDGFTVTLHCEEESIFPIPDKHGNTDYGSYVDERGSSRWGWDGEWNGNWPEPVEHAPLGLPYTSIRYHSPGWVQGEEDGYFIPRDTEEQYAYYRRAGQSKSVAWDLTKQWVEDQLKMLFSSPLTNMVVVITVFKEGVELATTAMGTDVSGDDEGSKYIFQMVEEYSMITEAIDDARETLKKLAV
jgi:hypothetical protein